MTEEEIVEFLTKNIDYFDTNNLVTWFLRELGWLLVKGFNIVIDVLKNLYNHTFGLVDITNSGVLKNFLAEYNPLIKTIMILSLVIVGYMFLFGKDKKHDVFTSLMIFAVVITSSSYLFGTFNTISSIEGQDDYDITLIGNDFTIYGKEDYEEGKVKYLSTTYHLFRDPYFRTLKPKQKLLVMDLLNIQMAGRPNGVNTYRIYRKNFIKKYANIKQNDEIETRGLLNITVRTLQKYFKLLKHYFSICLKNGMYFFTLKTEFARSEVRHTTENHITMQHLVKAACRRNKIKDPDVKEQEKIEKVLENREKEVLNRFVNISDVIRSMIETINEKIPDPRKWNRRLKATLFIKKFNEAVS